VQWLNQEAQQTVGGGTMEMTSQIAQRFALLSLEFSALDLEQMVQAQDAQDTTTTGSGFFGDVRQAPANDTIMNAEFYVHACNWTGVECSDDGNVVKLQWGFRDFTGSIPPEIGILSTITYLDLSHNKLTSTIPEELYQLSNLEELFLYHNYLSGTLSTRIGQLDKITRLNLSHNQLTGPVPNELKSDAGSVNGVRPLSK
jgi:hypothetical protein